MCSVLLSVYRAFGLRVRVCVCVWVCIYTCSYVYIYIYTLLMYIGTHGLGDMSNVEILPPEALSQGSFPFAHPESLIPKP